MKKSLILITLSIIGLVNVANAQLRVFDSKQVGTTPVANYYLKTDGINSFWAAVTGGGGGGTGVGWLWNSINSLYQSTTTDDVLLGAVSTTSTAKLEVIAGGTKPAAYFKGNVGIGTTSPYAPLSVAGEVVAEKFTATSTTATSTLRGGLNVQSYYLGIGTSTSGFTQGINIPDQTKITAITTGIETGWDYGLLNWNMFIGTGGQRNTIDHTIAQPDPLYPANGINGLYNTFVGMGAGDDNTVGNLNTFLGSLAGTANTTGGQNTFLGAVAGFSNTTGIHNTYIGVGAGESNIAGNHNVAVGTDALLNATNTLSGVYIGSGAGSNDNGSYNVAIGESSLAAANWGSSLFALGAGSLQNNSYGNKSIGIGRSALFYATSSDNNIAIGYLSGRSFPQPGNDNIFIGSDTYSAPGVYNSIAIGTSTYLGESNLIVLGNANVNKTYIGGVGGAGTVYAPNLQVSGNVGIGTTNPFNKLHTSLTSGQLALFGSQGLGVTNGNYAGIALGYSEAGPLYQKSAIVQSQVGDGSARGNILFLNNGTASNANASLADARMAITYAGNVGIGTTSPFNLLSVVGGSDQATAYFYNNGGSGKTRVTMRAGAGNSNIGNSDPVLSILNSSGIQTTFIRGDGLIGSSFLGSVDDTSAMIVDSNVDTGAYPAGLNFGSLGVVGWGSNQWWSVKDIGLSRGAAGKLYVGNGTQGDSSGTLISGKLGVGTSSPSQMFSVGSNNQFTVTSAGAATAASVQVGNMTVGTTGFYAGGGTAGQGRFYYDGGNGSTLQGQTASTYDTTLTNAAGSIIYANPTGTSVSYFAGNVGVGTTTPSTKLNIYGGGIGVNPGATSRPTCAVSTRGQYWQEFGGAGVKDTVAVCAKDAGDAYDWRTIY